MRHGRHPVRTSQRGPKPQTLFNHMNLPNGRVEEFRILAQPLSREEFIDTIARVHSFNDAERELLTHAYDVAEREFRQKERESGEPYFKHLCRCVLILAIVFGDLLALLCLELGISRANAIVGMLLHDLIEDLRPAWYFERVAKVFNEAIAHYVNSLTKLPSSRGIRKPADILWVHYQVIRQMGVILVLLKACDRLDNLITLWERAPNGRERTRRQIKKKLHETEWYLIPLLEKHRLHDVLRVIREVIAYIRLQLAEDHVPIGAA